MAIGVVREWHEDEGWGVLDSEQTPGGCWAHFSALSMAGHHRAGPGQRVSFTYEAVAQDGFRFRAVQVVLEGVQSDDTDTDTDTEAAAAAAGLAYQSRLTIEWD
jgi:CspA family cold shock protein